MPFNHARCRGATVLFRRNIPVDLRDRFGSGEIVRSLGHATPGEARRLVYRLWSRAAVDRIVSVALDGFRDDQDLAIAAIEPGVPAADRIDEPLNRSAYLNGLGA